MARHLRVEFPGAIYHITCRMIGDWRTEQTLLFKDDADRERFLERLGERVEQYNIRLYLYVLMKNHVHLVFETPGANCSKFMQSLSTAYTVYFNLRHSRHGHLFDGRYKAKVVEGEDYLLSLSRYVHLNPVQVGSQKRKRIEERIKALRAYKWSSYPGYIGRRKALDCVEYGPVLAEVGGKRAQWPKRYRQFVESGLAETDEDFKVALKESPRSIGSDGFRARVDDLYQKLIEKSDVPEDIAFRRITEPLDPDKVLAVIAEMFNVEENEFRQRRRGSPLRAVAARYLTRYAGQTQRQVAQLLNIGTGVAVSQQIKKLTVILSQDRKLIKVLKKIEVKLNELRQVQR